jgi:thymidine phosphorylase
VHSKIGDRVAPGERIGEIHARDRDAATAAAQRVASSLTLTENDVEQPPLVYGWHDAG